MYTENKKLKILGIGLGLALFAGIPISHAKDDPDNEYDMDKPPRTNHQISEKLALGSRIEFETNTEDNFNLDSTAAEDETRNKPLVSLALHYQPKEKISVFLNAELASYLYDDERNRKQDKTQLALVNAYISLEDVLDSFNISLGRMRFKDEREWLFDDELDGLKIKYLFNNGNLEFSMFDKKHKDYLEQGVDEDITNYLVYGKLKYDDDHEVRAYYLIQDDRTTANRNAHLYGLQAYGELGDLDYWTELGLAGGEDGNNEVDGFGYDVGFVYTHKSFSTRPRFILSYAYGSGDNDFSDGVDGNYRQSGYQDNASKNGGKARYNYYGEMVDIELSNLIVTTAGFGIHLSKNATVDVIYHTYEQDKASTVIRESEIDEIPNGLSTDLGTGMDIIFGMRHNKKLKISAIFGSFQPGQAFDTRDEALYTEFEIKYNF